jgi:cell division protein FtsB
MRRPRFRLRKLAFPAFAAAYLAYFGFHAMQGSYGIWAKINYDAEAVELQETLDAIRAEHADLERHMAMLRPASLDPDLVDERARRALNVLAPNEVIILDLDPE